MGCRSLWRHRSDGKERVVEGVSDTWEYWFV